jgi:hypothetical protein
MGLLSWRRGFRCGLWSGVTTSVRDTVFSWMPIVGAVLVNPGFFAENSMAALEPIAQFGLMTMPLGQGRNASPSNEDIARLVAGVLADPARHIGKTYRPTGPTLLSPTDIADTFAVAAPSDAVLQVTGHPAEDFETTVRRYVDNTPDTRRTLGSRPRALARLMRALAVPAPNLARYARTHDDPPLPHATLAIDSPDWQSGHNPSRRHDPSRQNSGTGQGQVTLTGAPT